MLIHRRCLLALGVWLVCSVVVWNVVFDRGVESAEERYLKAQPTVAPEGGIRAIMEPAVAHAARVATAWTLAVSLPVGIIIGLRRPRRPSASKPSPS